MGMGYCSSYADVIEEKDLVKIGECKNLLQQLKDLSGDNLQGVYEYCESDDDFPEWENPEEIKKVYKKLLAEFKKKTGLSLELGYHNSDEEGDRYDDVGGIFWCVGGMYRLSPAGKKMNDVVQRKFWVSYG